MMVVPAGIDEGVPAAPEELALPLLLLLFPQQSEHGVNPLVSHGMVAPWHPSVMW